MLNPSDRVLALDTVQTVVARLLGSWPPGVLVDRHYMTNHGRDSIKRALRELACAAGLQHNDWFNPGSSWYGPARRVRSLARITVALYKFGRAHMFGPGTACRWGALRARCSEQVQCPGAPPATPCPRSAPGGSGPTPAPCCSTCRRSPSTGACHSLPGPALSPP